MEGVCAQRPPRHTSSFGIQTLLFRISGTDLQQLARACNRDLAALHHRLQRIRPPHGVCMHGGERGAGREEWNGLDARGATMCNPPS